MLSPTFSFKIYDYHKKPIHEEGELRFDTYESIDWMVFDFVMDIREVRIVNFRGDVLFDSDGTPKKCTRVVLSDNDVIYAKVNFETFERMYNEDYLPKTLGELDPPSAN